MSENTTCYLRCLKDSHPPIILPGMKEIILGRSPETQITDKRCSRSQISFMADLQRKVVRVKQIGPNESSLNNQLIGKDKEMTAGHSDTVEFLLGLYTHVVEFKASDCHSAANTHESTGKKRTASPSTTNNSNQKMRKESTYSNSAAERWNAIDGGKVHVFTSEGVNSSAKIAAFDMDGTLILTKSGLRFPKNADDWKIIYSEIRSKVEKLITDGYKIVILTNQLGVTRGKTPLEEIKRKVENIISHLKVPIQAFIATEDDLFRKPRPGMWDLLVSEMNEGKTLDLEKTFYCGDAAGRPEKWAPKKKKDFSCSDRLFALNLGLKFYTPEEYFLRESPAPYTLPSFNPSSFSSLDNKQPDSLAKLKLEEKELLIMVGAPGSGKTFFCRKFVLPSGFVHINRDTLGTWQKCVSAAQSALAGKKGAVIDNTNPDKETRARYIEVARKAGVSCRCLVMNVPFAHARHNNKFREITGETHDVIPEMVMNTFKSKFQEPTTDEGFSQVISVDFIPDFRNAEHKRLYGMYLLDKY